jgi:hypothetical protein
MLVEIVLSSWRELCVADSLVHDACVSVDRGEELGRWLSCLVQGDTFLVSLTFAFEVSGSSLYGYLIGKSVRTGHSLPCSTTRSFSFRRRNEK